jgi:citrate lyase subunit beta/citryl-CoA lyase
MKKLRRTMLFIPGNNPGMLQSAGVLGADSIILDLEDAVSLSEKDAARILVKEALKVIDFNGAEVVVRINPLNTEFGEEDLKIIARAKPDAILIPKAQVEEILLVDKMLYDIELLEGFQEGSIKIIPLIETAYGLETVFSVIQSSKRIVAILLGGEDLTADLGVKRTRVGEEILYARNKVAVACKAGNIDSIDTPFTDTNDTEGLILDTEKAKSLGFTGKAVIGPRQIEHIHLVFSPTCEEIDYALKVVEAMEIAKEEGRGVFSLDGKMIDAPIINRALNTIELAKKVGLINA